MSDLHLETYPSYTHWDLPSTDAPYLALLGDIGHVGDDALYDFLTRLLDRYWIVFFLMGNHEPYQCSMEAAKTKMRKFEQKMTRQARDRTTGKFVLLDQTRYDVDGTLTILGCTLFSSIQEERASFIASRMVDFKDTPGWTVALHNKAHASDLQWLNSQVAQISTSEPQRQVVIFTHHSPTTTAQANDPRHNDSLASSAFVTDLSKEACWTSSCVKVWAFGHTHYNCDFFDEETRKKVVTNQKGYWRIEKGNFKAANTYLLPEGHTYPALDENVALIETRDVKPRSSAAKRGRGAGGLWQALKSRLL